MRTQSEEEATNIAVMPCPVQIDVAWCLIKRQSVALEQTRVLHCVRSSCEQKDAPRDNEKSKLGGGAARSSRADVCTVLCAQPYTVHSCTLSGPLLLRRGSVC